MEFNRGPPLSPSVPYSAMMSERIQRLSPIGHTSLPRDASLSDRVFFFDCHSFLYRFLFPVWEPLSCCPTLMNLSEILLIQNQIWVVNTLQFPCPKRNSIWGLIYRKREITTRIWFWINAISLCDVTRLLWRTDCDGKKDEQGTRREIL